MSVCVRVRAFLCNDVMPTFFHALDTKTAFLQEDKPTFHFSPLNSCLSVVLSLDKGAYPENSRVVSHQINSLLNISCFWILL